MLASSHATVASSVEGTRTKYELLTLALRRTTTGTKVSVKAHPSLEELFRDSAPRDPYDTASPLMEASGCWGLELYQLAPDSLFRNGFETTIDNAMPMKAAFRGNTEWFRQLGRPADSYSYPINLAWLRAKGLTDGIEFVVSHPMLAEDAEAWASVAAKLVDRIWRSRLQPYHVRVRVSVDALVDV